MHVDHEHGRAGGSCLVSLISAFLFVWIIVGSYYVFYNWPIWVDAGMPECNNGEANSQYCCASPLMYTSFILLILMYVLGGIFALAIVCLLFCLACFTLTNV